jgi:uncharacterized protein YciI
MYALVLIRYRVPLEQIEATTAEHRAYVAGLAEQGVVLASGPMAPRSGGALLVRLADDDPAGLDRIRDGDPYWRRGLANYELIGWNPGTGREALDQLGHASPLG